MTACIGCQPRSNLREGSRVGSHVLSIDEQGWALLKSRPDKEWSLVDAASFVVMRERGIHEALTTDHHFEQAGFARLLKP